MARFGTFNFGEELFGSGAASSIPYSSEDFVRVPWIFQALDDPDIYEFAVNPISAKMPEVTKTYSRQKTAAGGNVIFQGRNQPQTISFSGTILTQEHLGAMREWVSKEKQVYVRDDLARGFWVYLTKFNPSRQYSVQYPWRHEYSCEGSLLSWT